jgi:sialidase-1
MGDVAPTPRPGRANEVQFFERRDGTVVLNARQHHGARRRATAESRDGGMTWSAITDVPELPDPQCMAGVVSLGGGVVAFSGCDSESRRALGTLWISRDDGRTWPAKMLVEPGGFAYSVPVALGGGKVGVLHETAGYERIVFRVVEVPTPPVPMTAPRPQASP